MFADHLLLYKPISQPNDFQAVQEDITDVEQWSTANHLTLNPSKYKYLIISRQARPLQPESALILNGHILSRVDVYKYLGILLSSDLSWSPHVDAICSKSLQDSRFALHKVLSIFKHQHYSSALHLSIVRPHLEYMLAIYGHPTPPEISILSKACKHLPAK